MARDWRRAVLAALVAAMLAGACAIGAAVAQPSGDEAKAETKAKKKQDPAEAQRTIETALKQLQAGRVDQAVQALSATMGGGNLPPALLAKALYVRGMAYRKQGRTAQAISDLSGALWLRGGLGGDEREDAAKEKAAAYAEAGLSDPGSRAPKTKTAGSGNWFSGILGGLGDSQEASSPPPAAKVTAAPAERAEPAPASKATPKLPQAWTSKTEPEAEPEADSGAATEVVEEKTPPKALPPKASQTAKATASPLARKAEGQFLVQLAARRTEQEAMALAAKAKREHASLLGSRDQTVDRAVFGNMGAFYRVRFGPFASAQETQSVCARLQRSGIDCLPVSQ